MLKNETFFYEYSGILQIFNLLSCIHKKEVTNNLWQSIYNNLEKNKNKLITFEFD